MAARIGFEIADVAVDFGLRAGEHHVHVARPVRQRTAQRFRAHGVPMHHDGEQAAGEMAGIGPAGQF